MKKYIFYHFYPPIFIYPMIIQEVIPDRRTPWNLFIISVCPFFWAICYFLIITKYLF